MADRARILIVDDDPDTLDAWTAVLGAEGYLVSTAVDGLTALDAAVAAPPDVIVLDLDLPGRSGLDVAADLRRHPATHHIPLIAATGFSHEAQLERARRAGFDVIAIKPCDPVELVNHIERLVAAAASRHPVTEAR